MHLRVLVAISKGFACYYKPSDLRTGNANLLMDLTPEIVTFAGLYFLIFSTLDSYRFLCWIRWLHLSLRFLQGRDWTLQAIHPKEIPKSWVRATFLLYIFSRVFKLSLLGINSWTTRNIMIEIHSICSSFSSSSRCMGF